MTEIAINTLHFHINSLEARSRSCRIVVQIRYNHDEPSKY